MPTSSRVSPLDPNSGFYYRARWLDPNVGRFVSADGFSGYEDEPLSLHKYLYAVARPTDLSDPSGHDSLGSLAISIAAQITVFVASHPVLSAIIGVVVAP